jgi:ADP-ribosylglycohydrolase
VKLEKSMPMRGIRIPRDVYRDKVLGCWLGKNIGGTLGGPLEEKFGRDELFNVSWYPDLPEGGIPNDDLELQLIFFQALQDVGPGLTARNLADYWLDCVRYNFDEYGLSKTNLVKGLVPPVSGWHNNWFRDCMGSPIRSEVWACVAPGAPEIAARYAFEDSICDHGGGESVFGEIFNAVVESCAFVESDKLRLTEAGLSAIPASSLTAKAIQRVVELYRGGVDWVTARNTIKDEFYLALAQYSPINMGFQTIGFLYGENFADAICKAVNCGWDTDCTGATVGAMFGILLGARGLPDAWVAPLRDEISTNLPNGGIRHLRAPTDIRALTDQVCGAAPTVLHYWGSDTVLAAAGSAPAPEVAPQFHLDTDWLASYDPGTIRWDLSTLRCALRYHHHAAILGSEPAVFTVELENPHPEPVCGTMQIHLPAHWTLGSDAGSEEFNLPGQGRLARQYRASASPSEIFDSNLGTIQVRLDERPALEALPLVLLGGNRWLVSPVDTEARDADSSRAAHRGLMTSCPTGWLEFWSPGNELMIEPMFQGRPGVMKLLHCIESPSEQEVIIGFSNNSRMKMWLNGEFLHETRETTPIRPNQGNGGGDGANYTEAILRKGMNQVLIQLERFDTPVEAHFTLGKPDRTYFKCLGHAILGLRRSLLPWDRESLA